MKVGVVGGGINGIMSAWALARRGCQVTLFERGELMGATSSASTKLLHGGIRYLESGHFSLVREALRERRWWIEQAPHLAHRLKILIPVYAHSRRGRWTIRAGLALYDLLAGSARLGPSSWLDPIGTRALLPTLNATGLRGAYAFFDAQMDDRALGGWAAQQAATAGVEICLRSPVTRVDTTGRLFTPDDKQHEFHRVVNAAGPWTAHLLESSGIESRFELDLVRGSHLLVDRPHTVGVLLEMPDTERICFVLPYQGKTLIGTTEVRQSLDQPVICSQSERVALVDLYNRNFEVPLESIEDIPSFAGLRPLLKSASNPTRATREYGLERHGRLVCVFGGKWTTARALGEKVALLALA